MYFFLAFSGILAECCLCGVVCHGCIGVEQFLNTLEFIIQVEKRNCFGIFILIAGDFVGDVEV
jgi:hypothetical protein